MKRALILMLLILPSSAQIDKYYALNNGDTFEWILEESISQNEQLVNYRKIDIIVQIKNNLTGIPFGFTNGLTGDLENWIDSEYTVPGLLTYIYLADEIINGEHHDRKGNTFSYEILITDKTKLSSFVYDYGLIVPINEKDTFFIEKRERFQYEDDYRDYIRRYLGRIYFGFSYGGTHSVSQSWIYDENGILIKFKEETNTDILVIQNTIDLVSIKKYLTEPFVHITLIIIIIIIFLIYISRKYRISIVKRIE